MLTGLLLLLGTGIGWAGLAAVVSAGRTRHAPIMLVQPMSAVLVLLFAGWSFFLFGGALPEGKAFYMQLGCLIGAGAANYFMLILVQKAMESGRGGVVWSFTQSSMICPFLMGMTVFGEPPAPGKVGGIIFILSALILFSLSKESKGKSSSGKWLIATLGAFALSGTAQCFASLPSYYQLAGMTAMRRMLIMQSGIVLAFLLDRTPRKFSGLKERNVWIFAACFGGLNLCALLCFYNGLNLLADAKCASSGYPAAQGISVVLFFLYTAFRNREPLSAWIAMILLCIGILLLAL